MTKNVLRLTDAEYADLIAGRKNLITEPVKTNKFHAQQTEADGIKFHSKKEARYFRELQARQHMGEIKFFLMQVPFRLPGNVKHYLDFMAVRPDGQIEYIEAKGRDLPMGKLKRKQVEELYGIKIVVV